MAIISGHWILPLGPEGCEGTLGKGMVLFYLFGYLRIKASSSMVFGILFYLESLTPAARHPIKGSGRLIHKSGNYLSIILFGNFPIRKPSYSSGL